jgi:PKHD-type hydroxylase
LLSRASFVDGKLSAGAAAERVKHNQELPGHASELGALNDIVMGNLTRHPTYLKGVLPRRVATPFYARYVPGMSYGEHIDDPIMGSGERYRSDVSITVFLSDAEDYEGGELVIATSLGQQSVKLPAGHAVLYPSSTRHRVAEVTRGERLVAVTWAQSMVRDPARREILFELGQARDRLLRKRPDAAETAKVDLAYVNLIRMWADV